MIDEASLRATIDLRVDRMVEQATEARRAIDNGDYSAAATACHRAYQHRLTIDALEFVLEEEQL